MDNDVTHRVARPFSTLEELYREIQNLEPWPEVNKLRECTEYVYSGREICDSDGNTQLSKLARDRKPKTIVCHDMQGGYLEDRFLNGSLAHNSYVFYHWSIIDIFIYFSHHLVTIPPYGWINAAHNHGVQVLGTVITERNDGEIIWEQVLSSIEETKKFANALIICAKFYKFDGWLLNIENVIPEEHIQQLLYFVQYLSVGMHTEIEHSKVIWYDSVTVFGKLHWQNQLNEKNKAFFENCDGIFLNYNWTDTGLASSQALANLTDRIHDVYVGLDVWGRGCPGGGGFNSIEALEGIRKYDLSVAIFGPGWTHEFFNGKEFKLIENVFWAQLIPHLYIHVPIYDNVPFTSTFCHGSGEKYYYSGEYDEISSLPFYNLSWQQLQISIPCTYLRFTSVDCPKKEKIGSGNNNNKNNNNNNNTAEAVVPVCTYESAIQIIRVRDHEISIEKKPQRNLVNGIYFSTKYPFNGGGSIRIVSNYQGAYYRLFLVHLEFSSDVQIIILVHRSDENSDIYNGGNQASRHPTLIFENNQTSQHINPYETLEINGNWKQSYYRSINMRTISAIGVSFAKEGSYYLGKIHIQQLSSILQ